MGLRAGSVSQNFFFILVKVSLVPRALPLFDEAWLREEPSSVTIVRIDSEKALVN